MSQHRKTARESRVLRVLCTLGFAISVLSVFVHFGAGLGTDFDSNAPVPRSDRLYAVAVTSFLMACVGALLAFGGLVGLVVARDIRQDKRCLWLASAAVIGPLYLAIVYGSLFLLKL